MSKHGSRPYNPDIANAFFRAGEIEAWGRGVERINTACKEAGYKEPTFKYDGTGLWIIFEYPKTTPKTTQKTTQKLTDVQKAIINYIIEHPQATRKEIAEHISNVTEDGIKYHLSRLQKMEILERIGGRKSGYWKVND